ncbi:MAG: hypothetical protein OYH77_04255 [Pseudomonadota bacterium]|nr:hypothetical protein [Pseudomonadota bacterium]
MNLAAQIEAHARAPQFRINPSLVQMRRVLSANPVLNLQAPTIIIGGTNGKGTTAGYLFTLLHKHLKLKVGLYTSPHLHHFHERIQLSHVAVNDELLAQHWRALVATTATESALSFFEWATLLAFYTFNTHATDINILEVGLGGKWDATNIVNPIAAVLVSLGQDHQRLLGNTYREILADKIAITRRQRPLFWGNQGSGANDPMVKALIQQVVAEKNIQLYRFGVDFFLRATGVYQQDMRIITLPASVVSAPPFLQNNFCLAAAVWHWYRSNYSQPKNYEHCPVVDTTNYLPTTIVGRCQHLRLAGREVITDVCHNIDGALMFSSYLRQRQRKLTGFVCLLADKDIAEILAILATCLQPLYFFSLSNIRAAAQAQLPKGFQRNFYADFNRAWQAANPTGTVVICGSFYGLDAALTYLRNGKAELP